MICNINGFPLVQLEIYDTNLPQLNMVGTNNRGEARKNYLNDEHGPWRNLHVVA